MLVAKSKIVLAPASTAFQHSMKEVLAVPAIANQIKVVWGEGDGLSDWAELGRVAVAQALLAVAVGTVRAMHAAIGPLLPPRDMPSPALSPSASPAAHPLPHPLQDTKAAKEVAALQAFYAMMANDPARAFYGPGHVWAAHELGAVKTLLISEGLFRTRDVATRRRYVDLVAQVEQGGPAAPGMGVRGKGGWSLSREGSSLDCSRRGKLAAMTAATTPVNAPPTANAPSKSPKPFPTSPPPPPPSFKK